MGLRSRRFQVVTGHRFCADRKNTDGFGLSAIEHSAVAVRGILMGEYDRVEAQ